MKTFQVQIPEGYEIDKEQSTFENIVFKPLKEIYPKTWEDCISKLLKTKGTSFAFIQRNSDIGVITSPIFSSRDFNLLPSKEDAEKFLILQKLYTCRQAYVGDWKPNWNDGRLKYIISVKDNEIFVDNYYNVSRKFIFPTSEMAEEFLKNFKEDLEQVKDLI